MNKCIKKSLIIYISLTLVLIGMTGAAYAITAVDAGRYITRSEFATDMSYLQTKLEEKESSLLGEINRLRSTDVKFVTWDTPNKYKTGNTSGAGYHNGGNYFVRPRPNSNGGTQYGWGINTNGGSTYEGKYPTAQTLNIYRLYNGNYYVTPNLAYDQEASTNNVYYYPGVNFAVPIENLPGWYMVICILYVNSNGINLGRFALVKLDTSIPYPTTADEYLAIKNKPLIMRFKKDMFVLAREDNTGIFSKDRKQASQGFNRYIGNDYATAFVRTQASNITATDTQTVTIAHWLDPATGDFMQEIKGMDANVPAGTPGGTGGASVSYRFTRGDAFGMSNIIPRDNVEYVSGANVYYEYTNPGSGIPVSGTIGTRDTRDAYWDYEFVDCVNGLKYWHARKRAATEMPAGVSVTPTGTAANYSLPIVY
jgi:hypothetical protein